MSSIVLRAAICLAPALALSSIAAQEPFPGLDAYIAKAVQASKIPGVGVAIVRNDSVLYTKGFGVLAAGSTTPVDDQTLFEIGSSSKSFTATLVAMMVAEGKMRYDDRVARYLPDLKLFDPVASAELTVRDALTHRAGLSRGELIWLGSGVTRAEVLYRVRFLKPQSPFRSRYSYQNIMVLAAGEAAEGCDGSVARNRGRYPRSTLVAPTCDLRPTTATLCPRCTVDHATVLATLRSTRRL
jgi:CubicO group peptidase (beta-lactamase class C family)